MAISKIVQNSLDTTSISLGPKISSVQVANSTYVVKDDTAVNTGGGYIVVTGSGFTSNSTVLIGSNNACSVTFISSTQLRAQVPSATPGSYPVYVVTGDGGTAIRINALTYSDSPTWVTTSPLTSQVVDTSFSFQLSATGANTYVLQTGSTLPSGVSLAANGLLSGTVTGLNNDTTYNFTVEAVDAESQESPKALAVTISAADPYYNITSLHLAGEGTNNGNNNVFLDSSNNNFSVTRTGTPTQGTFTPWSPSGFSGYFPVGSDGLTVPVAIGDAWSSSSATFTVEANVYLNAYGGTGTQYYNRAIFSLGSTYLNFGIRSDGYLQFYHYTGTGYGPNSNVVVPLNTWTHVAAVVTGQVVTFYINGTARGTSTYYGHVGTNQTNAIGYTTDANGGDNRYFNGFINNFRISNNARYTGNFTAPTADFTSDGNTVLLTLRGADNRARDTSSNGYAVNGFTRISTFSPYRPSAVYSAATYGGSGYFDGTGDYLVIGNNAAFDMTGVSYCFETWVYFTSDKEISIFNRFDGGGGPGLSIQRLSSASGQDRKLIFYTGTQLTGSGAVREHQWHHLAFTFDGTTKRIFLNGVLDASATGHTNWQNSSSLLNMYIGNRQGDNREFDIPGYMAGTRITKGAAVYTTAFTPPTAPPVPISGTSLLLNYTNASVIDSTTDNDVLTLGSAVVTSTTIKKYGSSSIYMDGSAGSRLQVRRVPALNLFGDFTVEGWFYPTDLTGSAFRRLFSFGTFSEANSFDVEINYNPGPATVLRVNINTIVNGSNSSDSAGGLFTSNTWFHIAVTRSSGTVKAWLNGTNVITINTSVTAAINKAQDFYLGSLHGYEDTASAIFKGYIDDFRITNGLARYTANFEPPTGAMQTR
jgi:hypothetical protein